LSPPVDDIDFVRALELQRSRGIDACVGDVQRLPFERRDATGWTTMDTEAIGRFAASWKDLGSLVKACPFEEPLRVTRHSTVFVAEAA
jgi:hypothetical protein